MSERIRRHRERRPAHWQTVEAPLNPVGALQTAQSGHAPLYPVSAQSDAAHPPILLLDSLDGWVSNLLFEHETTPAAELQARTVGAARRFASFVHELNADAVIVSSEVGQSLVATSALGRQFQDLPRLSKSGRSIRRRRGNSGSSRHPAAGKAVAAMELVRIEITGIIGLSGLPSPRRNQLNPVGLTQLSAFASVIPAKERHPVLDTGTGIHWPKSLTVVPIL